jgi:hypothetical protein
MLQTLPLLNFSSVVAFLTWFGAAGFGLLHFAAWPLLPALVLALVAGLAGALLIAVFLERLVAGERGEMDVSEYRLPGTLARVTVSIPATGVGEILFSKGGVRRSEAARSLTGRPIPRATEVVILQYGRGVAGVQPWKELLEEHGAAPARRPTREAQGAGAEGPAEPAAEPAAGAAAVETPGGPGV